jgi:hypothetical protein
MTEFGSAILPARPRFPESPARSATDPHSRQVLVWVAAMLASAETGSLAMRWNRTLLILPLLAALPLSASAGIFFGKKATKPDPATRVPELIVIVKTDGDENKRAAAAEELRQYDPRTQHDIVPILIDVLLHDAKPSVRAEAAASLGKLRPISQEAGWALEQAVAKDPSMRVRLQARSALLMYHLAGYHSTKVEEPPTAQGKEPPTAPPAPPAVKTTTTPPGRTPPPVTANRLVPMPVPSLVPAPKAPVRPTEEGPSLTPPP